MKKLFNSLKIILILILIFLSIKTPLALKKIDLELQDIRNQSKYIYKRMYGGIKNIKPAKGELREKQLKIMKTIINFDKFAKKNNIEYWIDYGSLIGVARHSGFIPWDDDFDLSVTEDNLEKLISLSKDKQNEIKMIPVDGIGLEPLWFFQDRIYGSDIFKHVCITKENYKKVLKFSNLASWTKFFRKNYRKDILNKILKLKKDMKDCKSGDLIMLQSHQRGKKGADSIEKANFEYDDIYPLKKMIFEGYLLSVPNNVHAVLSKRYSENYLDLPNRFGFSHHVEKYLD